MSLKSRYSEFNLECGTDEAGRGCLAGPVTAAAIIQKKSFSNNLLNDSKLLSEKIRAELKPLLEHEAISFSVMHVMPEEIDNINILNASILAMHKSIDFMKLAPEYIVVDGNRFTPYKNIPFKTIIKGDSKYLSLAAASVLAKTHRDAYMERIHLKY